jgi:tellurite resistance protein
LLALPARLTRLSPPSMRVLLTACARVADADGHIDVEEGELLRAFAAHWDCPLPPVWTPAALARV